MQATFEPKRIALVLAALVLLAPAVSGVLGSSSGTSNGANKTSAAGSSIEILGPSIAGTPAALTATLLETTVKTSAPTDLLLQVTLECALWTKITTVGNDVSESTARVKVWVEIDGTPVRVASDDTEDPGKVVFCDRTHRQETSGFDDENATIEQFLRTRTANAFNWVALDVGSAVHTVTVKAELSGETLNQATSQAGIGHRTLIVEPTKFLHGATI